MNKKKLFKILLAIGILAFAIPLIYGIYCSIHGVSFMFNYIYGFDAFYITVFFYSWFLWPTYIIGILLIIISAIKLKKL